MTTTTTETGTEPVASRPVQQRGDRVFAALAKTAGIVNLVVLAGVAIFLVARGVPRAHRARRRSCRAGEA